jgi:hypothetical protein
MRSLLSSRILRIAAVAAALGVALLNPFQQDTPPPATTAEANFINFVAEP